MWLARSLPWAPLDNISRPGMPGLIFGGYKNEYYQTQIA
jgi:hypothetical protein